MDCLNPAQFAEMDYIFRSACQGLDSPDIRKIYEQHSKKSLFYHLSSDTGLRYHFDINKRKGTVVILSVDADNKRISSEKELGNGIVEKRSIFVSNCMIVKQKNEALEFINY